MAPGPKIRLSRRVGIALTPKASKFLEKRPYPPGEHGRRRASNPSDYKIQLVEKQRLRYQYDIREKQLKTIFEEAKRRPGQTGENLISLLEQRLDAVVLRAGLAKTIYQARQFVGHGHVQVDGKKIDRRSYRVHAGQVIKVLPSAKALEHLHDGELHATPPAYIETDAKAQSAKFVQIPIREAVPVICDEQLVVEFYSR